MYNENEHCKIEQLVNFIRYGLDRLDGLHNRLLFLVLQFAQNVGFEI